MTDDNPTPRRWQTTEDDVDLQKYVDAVEIDGEDGTEPSSQEDSN